MNNDYDDLVQNLQSGEIDNLQFLLGQEDLSQLFLEEMKTKNILPSDEAAQLWLTNYENKHLYQ